MSRFNTGNPLGSGSPLDLDDNAKNLDEAANSPAGTFQDRLGKSRLTWAGIVKAGSGDPAIAVDAAARAVDAAANAVDAAANAESSASNVEQNAEQIAQEAAQQAVDNVVVAVDGQVAIAENAADRAEAASNAAFVNADVYPDVASGRAAVADGEQFQVANADSIVRYRRDSASTHTQLAHYPSAGLVSRVREEAVRSDQIVQQSTNLATRVGELLGKVISADGAIVDNVQHKTTDFIPVTPGGTYTTRTYQYVSEYSASKEFIRRKAPSGILNGDPWQASNDAFFVRFNYQPSRSDSIQRQLNAGPVLLPFEHHYVRILPTAFAGGSINGAALTGRSVSLSKTDFAETGLNLFNPDSVTVGKVILANGAIEDNSQFSITGFIDVEPGETYSRVGAGVVFSYVAQYDSGGNFLTRTGFSTLEALTENTSMVRLIFQGSPSADRMFYKGSDPVEYEPYKVVIKGLEVPENQPEDRFMPDVPLEGIFSGVDYSSIWPEYALNITAAAVYQKYDELMAEFPEYITKQVLGEDEFGYTIAAYHLSPGWPQTSYTDLKRPKIFITAGTHGYESIPPLACYLTFRDMLTRWQDDHLLEALKYNADYIIIPVVNPSGFDDYTRTNRNGVDINRNFPEGWSQGTPGTVTYGGPEPFSEPESRLIKKVFDENPDIAVCYDFHNFSGTSNTTNFIWIPTGQGRRVQHMASNLITSLTRKWRKEYDWFPPEPYFAGYTNGTSGGMVQDYAKGLGINYSATFEVCGRWWVDPNTQPFDGTHRTTMVEAWANWLLINMRELKRDM